MAVRSMPSVSSCTSSCYFTGDEGGAADGGSTETESIYTIALSDDDNNPNRPSMNDCWTDHGGTIPPHVALRLSTTATDWGPVPQPVICQFCHKSIITITRKRFDYSAWVTTVLLVVISIIFWPCLLCVIIQCWRLFMTEHKCPDCAKVVGAYRR